MPDWKVCLARATGLAGFQTLSTAGPGDLTPLAAAITAVGQQWIELRSQGNWQQIASHIQALSQMSVQTVSFAVQNTALHLVLGRVPPQYAVDSESDALDVVGRWANALKGFLPRFQLSETVTSAANSVVSGSGANAALQAGAGLLLGAHFGRGVDCKLVVVASSVTDDFRKAWTSKDLDRHPIGGAPCEAWLWETARGQVVSGGRGPLDQPGGYLRGGFQRPAQLTQNLQQVVGCRAF